MSLRPGRPAGPRREAIRALAAEGSRDGSREGSRSDFEPVRVLEVRYAPHPERVQTVGRLAALREGIVFEYAPSFLHRPVPLSPYHLPVRPRLYPEPSEPFGGLSGLFADALPDAFGRLVTDRAFAMRGVDLRRITPLDRLAVLGTRAMGALTFHPEQPLESLRGVRIDLGLVAANAAEVLEGRVSDVLPALIAGGSSPGGARPKVVVGLRVVGDASASVSNASSDPDVVAGPESTPDGYTPVIVKFNAPVDAPDAGRVEMAYAEMARAAGLSIPRTYLLITREATSGAEQAFFAADRFDRGGEGVRIHVHTASGLLHLPADYPALEYGAFLGVVRNLTQDHRAAEEGYRRMVFNVLAHNRDDHPKNIACVMDQTGAWHLAPAYDLTYATGPGGEHTMLVHGEGRRITGSDLTSVAREASIPPRDAQRIIDQVSSAVAAWPQTAAAWDVPRARIAAIAGALSAVGKDAGVTGRRAPVGSTRVADASVVDAATDATIPAPPSSTVAPGPDDATAAMRAQRVEDRHPRVAAREKRGAERRAGERHAPRPPSKPDQECAEPDTGLNTEPNPESNTEPGSETSGEEPTQGR